MHTSERKATLLHLTDLHFGPATKRGHYWNSDATELDLEKHDRRGLLGSLIDDLSRQKFEPDLVLVTGDLLDRGARSGVRPAVEFLSRLADELGLARGRIIVIPGNHDVLRVPDPAKRYALFDAIRESFYGGLRKPFAAGTPPYKRVEHFDFAQKLAIEVVAFNSCEALNPPKQEHGSVGLAQRREAEALLSSTEGKGLFRIAVMHHHLERPTGVVHEDISVMDDAGATREWLADHRFHLALHGHQHVAWDRIEEIRGWFLSISAGASAGVALYGRSKWEVPLGYQVITIQTSETGRRIRREYDPQAREWGAAGRGAAESTLRFGAGGAGKPKGLYSGQVPTKGSLRELLAKVLPVSSQFQVFCVVNFPDVAIQISGEMPRASMEILLLQMKEPADILRELRHSLPEATAKHEALLSYA